MGIDSQKVYEASFAHNQDIIIICDALTRNILTVNQTFESITGIKLADTLHLTIEQLTCWLDPDNLLNLIGNIREGKPLLNAEVEMINVSDHWQHALTNIRQEKVDEQNLLFCHFHDITYRKQCAIELQKSEERLRLALNATNMGAWEWDIETNQVHWSDRVEKIFGLEKGAFGEGLEDYQQLIHPDDAPVVEAAIAEAIARKTNYQVQHRIVWPDGSIHWLEGKGEVFTDAKGNAKTLSGTVADITIAKSANDALKKSEKNLERAQEIARIGSYSWDLKTNEIIWSLELYRIFHIDSAIKGQSLWREFIKAVHPEDQEKLNSVIDALLNEHRSTPLEYRVLLADKQERIVYANGDIVFDRSGKPSEIVGFVQDVTERRLADIALQKSQAMLRKVLDTIPVRVYWKDNDLKYIGCNHLFALDVGLENVEEIIGKSDSDLIWHSHAEKLHEEDCEILNGEKHHIESQFSIGNAEGNIRHFESCKVLLTDENKNTIGLLGIYEDVTEKKNIENVKNRLLDILEATPDLVGMFDVNGRIEYLNMAGRKLLKIPEDKSKNLGYIGDFHSSKYLGQLDSVSIPYAIKHQSWRGETIFRNTQGQDIPTSQVIVAHKDEDEKTQYYSTIARDMSERNAYLAALEHQANHDPLTSLANRNLLYKIAEAEIQKAKIDNKSVALLLMDLDRFKEINDTLGHHTGDLLLKQIGPRFATRADDDFRLMARLGGDEFAVLIAGIERGGKVDRTVKNILEGIQLPFELDGLRVEIGGSIGIAMYPENGDNVSTLMRCADVAMYHAKHHKQGYAYYSAEHDQHSPRRLSLMTELGKALRNNDLKLYFQPKVDIKNNTVSGFEALLRWNHARHGNIPPDQFIPLAETGELIRPLTLWVLENAIKHCKTWLRSGYDAHVAVNMSVRNLMDEGYAEQIEKMLEEHDLSPQYLELEITESAVMSDPTRALNNLQRLNEYGIKLAIDDFGTGYSSLVYLKRLPIHSLKIDLSFVTNMIENEQDAIIVNSIVNLAHNLGLKVIAEGVKSQAILDALEQHGCDEAQGFYIGKPMDIVNTCEYLAARDTHCGLVEME